MFDTHLDREHTRGWINVRSLGAQGDGVSDDTAVIQRAINMASPFCWQGTTRATEKTAGGGTVFFPKGVYRFTAKLRLAPGVRLLGESEGVVFTAADGFGSGLSGSILFADLAAANTYAIDTSPYNAAGVRVDDTLLAGNDSSNGVATFLDAIQIERLRIRGNGNVKGLNLAGATTVRLSGVYVTGFIVGVRLSASWYGHLNKTTIQARWKGLIVYLDVTQLTLSAFSSQQSGAAYDPTVSGWDGSEPPLFDSWTATENAKSAAIFNYYGFITGHGVTAERFQVAFASYNARENITGIYVEGVSDRIIQASGADEQHCYYDFSQINGANGNLIWMQYARLHVRVRSTNYTSGAVGKVIELASTLSQTQYMPVIEGIDLKTPGDPIATIGDFAVRSAASAPAGAIVARGNGAPAFTAPKGSRYTRLDGDGALYVNTMGTATWMVVPGVAVSADRGDTDQTLTVGTDFPIQRWATALTVNRTVTLSVAGASNGDTFRVVRTGLGAFTLNVGGLKTIPAGTAAFVDVAYDGAAWRLVGYGLL